MTKQEMFARAVRGLRSQGWQVAYDTDRRSCVYATKDGKRCAWGWVDPDLTWDVLGDVVRLFGDRVGLAGKLDVEGFKFAVDLQRAHDQANSPEDMLTRFRELGRIHQLEWPND